MRCTAALTAAEPTREPSSALVVPSSLDVVDPRVAPTEERQRPDEEEEEKEGDFHALTLPYGYY